MPLGKGIVGARSLGSGPSVAGGTGSVIPSEMTHPGMGIIPFQGQQQSQPIPGVAGVTPGAIERRLTGFGNPSQALNPRYGMSASMQMKPTMKLGNTVGADPNTMFSNVALIRQLLQSLGQ